MKMFMLTFVAIFGFALSMPVEHEPDSDLDTLEDAANFKIDADETPVESQEELDESRDLETAVPEDVEFPEFEENEDELADETVYNQDDSEGIPLEEEDESEDTTDTTSQAMEDTDDTPAASEEDSMETAVDADMIADADAVKITAEEIGSLENDEIPESDFESQDENNESEAKQGPSDENVKDEDKSLDIPEIAAEKDEEEMSEEDDAIEAADEPFDDTGFISDPIEDTIEAADITEAADATGVVADAIEEKAEAADTIEAADEASYATDDVSDFIE